MNSTKQPQKKKILSTAIYATIIGLLVLACAIVIAMVSNKTVGNKIDVGGEDGEVIVSTSGYVLPMNGATVVKDYSATEHQFNDTLKQWDVHKAIDFKNDGNLDVCSIADGTVAEVYTNYLEGTVVKIKHSDGLLSIYKSLAKDVTVKVGSRVNAGTVIGKASDSMAEESKTGAHLHFEMELDGEPVDPYNYISLADK